MQFNKYSHVPGSKSKDQPGKVTNPGRGRLNRENGNLTVPFAPENLVSRDGSAVLSRVSLLISILRLNLVLTYGIPPDFRDGVYLCIQTAIHHRVSPEFIESHNCVPMAFTAENPPAQSR